MKRWRRFESHLTSGLWHVHTNRTDGSHSVEELVAFAADRGFPLLGIVEHVRRDLTYDFHELYDDVSRAASAYDVETVVGCEAKVIDTDGTLDLSADVRDRADIVYAAYHGTPFSRAEYVESLRSTLANPDVDVWAHPFSYLRREGFDLDESEREAILDRLRNHDVLFEVNLRRPTTEATLYRGLGDVATIVGYDLHDLNNWTV